MNQATAKPYQGLTLHHLAHRNKKASWLQNVLDDAVKIFGFIMSQPLSPCRLHLCCLLKYDGRLEEKHLYNFEL